MNQDEVRSHWAGRTGEYSPEYYAYYGRDETSEAVRRTVERYVGPDAAVLEVGCSCGRHLAHLQAAGFEDLAGIELNPEAFDVMAEHYPDLADRGTFYSGAVEEFVREFEDDRFDVVYSVETLQHIHPDAEWVFAELARVTADLLVTVEVESPVVADGEDDAAGDGSDSTGSGPDRTDAAEATGSGSDPGSGPADSGSDPPGPEAASTGSGGASNGPGADPTWSEGDPADADGSNPSTNYVHGEIPLYYRDWGRVFSNLGLVEVEHRDHRRDTVRAFRWPSADDAE